MTATDAYTWAPAVDPAPRIVVIRVTTPEELAAVIEIRRRVFAEEQRSPELRLLDPDDEQSVIALATIEEPGRRWAIATGRLTLPARRTSQATIAWVATLPEKRGLGAGGRVMRYLLDTADDARASEVVLAAQIHAEPFYRQLGFLQAGPLYEVRGIVHRRMIRPRPLT